MHHTQSRFANCAHSDCDQPTVGKSKYCRAHRALARTAFKAKCEADKAERTERYVQFRILADKAYEAGIKAGQDAVPTPMYIKGYEPIVDGMCGFAWVTVHPGNCSFAIWAKKNAGYAKAYRGGVQYWVHEFNQSVARKEAFARAYADVLRTAGIEAVAGSRLD